MRKRDRSSSHWLGALLWASGLVACGAEPADDAGAGAGTGGSATGGAATGGVATGGTATGGFGTGGATGGSATGGSATGGSATGGVATGGFGTGGVATGGTGGELATGGSATGGATTGGASTGGTGSGGAASGGTAGFSPCPAEEPCKILPLGDSITEGMVPNTNPTQFNGGYRVKLFELAVGDGKNITFVGTRSNGPNTVAGRPFPKNNEGYSGIRISALDQQHVPSKLAGAHIVLLHIGTNDMSQGGSSAPEQLEPLIDQIIEALPDSLLVVSNIIPFPPAQGATNTYNATIPGIVAERAAEGAHIIFVDQNSEYPTSTLTDSVHPNAEGYAYMGGVWYEAIKSYLR